jgi:hypothetical protein
MHVDVSDPRWLPPSGGPEHPRAPMGTFEPPSRPSVPEPQPGPSALHIIGGVAALTVGISAIVFADSMKLDTQTVLTGGSYLKDGYRAFMTASGIALAAVGGLLVLLAALNTSRTAGHVTFAIACLLACVVVAEGAIAVAGISANEREQQAESSADQELAPSADDAPAADEPPTELDEPPVEPAQDPVPRQEANGGFVVSCGSGGCFANKDVPVYPINVGDGCLKDGRAGDWQSAGVALFECQTYTTRPPGPTETPDDYLAVACDDVACFQASLRVEHPVEGERCSTDRGDGTWTRVETVDASSDEIFRCLGDA